jgi:hypothetical protein
VQSVNGTQIRQVLNGCGVVIIIYEIGRFLFFPWVMVDVMDTDGLGLKIFEYDIFASWHHCCGTNGSWDLD